MAKSSIQKSFKLDSEPVLIWPKIHAKLMQLDGFALNYSGTGKEYSLQAQRGSSVRMVGWDPNQKLLGWRNLFSETEGEPTGLKTLSALNETSSDRQVCDWVSQHGLLGFWPKSNPSIGRRNAVPLFVYGGLIYHFEPLDCIRSAAKRAHNVMRLWMALNRSFRGADVHELRSVLKQDKTDSSQVGSDPILYRVFVNGERRSRQPAPKTPREWRYLATVLLAEYLQEHIMGNIRVSLGVREQNIGENEEEDIAVQPPIGWNLMPLWQIDTALTAYYVELLMVMRRFRACSICGEDISHQRAQSLFCGDKSSCRTKNWHRQRSAERKAAKASMR